MTEQPKRQGFPIWILAVVVPAVGAFLLCCCGIGFVAYRWESRPAPAAPQNDPQVKVEDGRPDAPLPDGRASDGTTLNGYHDMMFLKPPGTQIPLKTFTLKCQLTTHPAVSEYPGLLAVHVGMFACVEKDSAAGRDISRLIGDGKSHRLTVELGPPRRRMRADQMFEIIRVLGECVPNSQTYNVRVTANQPWQDSSVDLPSGSD
jgi:hypothetical protein